MTAARTSLKTLALALTFAIVTMAGCGGAGVSLISPVNTSGSIRIEITRDSSPEFRWTENVIVQQIRVMNFSSGGSVSQVLWGYGNTEISSPVTYGDIIAGGLNLTGSTSVAPLQSGRKYRVQVTKSGESSYSDWVMP